MKKKLLSILLSSAIAFSSTVFVSFADEEATDALPEAQITTAVQSDANEENVGKADESATVSDDSDREDTDPFENSGKSDIPLSFYIGGGVLVAFIIASIVVLILGKSDKKQD